MLDELGAEANAEGGFFIAILAIAIAWNLDWRHYVRYWLGPHPPYSRRSVIATRVFLLLNLLGTALTLVGKLAFNRPPMIDIGYWLLDGLVIAAAFFILDGIFRLVWGRPKK